MLKTKKTSSKCNRNQFARNNNYKDISKGVGAIQVEYKHVCIRTHNINNNNNKVLCSAYEPNVMSARVYFCNMYVVRVTLRCNIARTWNHNVW